MDTEELARSSAEQKMKTSDVLEMVYAELLSGNPDPREEVHQQTGQVHGGGDRMNFGSPSPNSNPSSNPQVCPGDIGDTNCVGSGLPDNQSMEGCTSPSRNDLEDLSDEDMSSIADISKDLEVDPECLASIIEVTLLSVLSKQSARQSPTITANIDDLVEVQKVITEIENHLMVLFKHIHSHWPAIQAMNIDVDIPNNSVSIRHK